MEERSDDGWWEGYTQITYSLRENNGRTAVVFFCDRASMRM